MKALFLAARSRKIEANDKFAIYQNALLSAMQKAGLKELQHEGVTISRKAIPAVTCRSCHHELPTPEGISKDHKPEILTVHKT
jgi:hypothetical protein